MSAENCARGLEKAHIPRSENALGGIDHEIPCHTRLRFDEILATVCPCTYQNEAIFTFFSGEKTIAAFDLNLCQIKSTNVGNNTSKAPSILSIILEMTCD